MSKFLKILIAFFFSWLFFFPLSFTMLPTSVNSKMFMAVLGIVFLIGELSTNKKGLVTNKDFIILLCFSIAVSIIAYESTVVNSTDETAYTTYFMSMLVWLSAAYASSRFIKYAHGEVSVDIVSNYIIGLCTVQCIVALLIDVIPALDIIVSRYIIVPNGATWESRLIGLGVAFDTAGTRMSVGLVICSAMILKHDYSIRKASIYIACFAIIFILGNMMSRTTTVGAIIAIGLFIYKSDIWRFNISGNSMRVFGIIAVSLAIIIPLLVILYRNSPEFKDLIDFGFEGFLNYIKNGQWESRSNDVLQVMWRIWPTSTHTWMFGDGYFADPVNPKLFYMGTDVGYARLIFLFGLLGLSAFLAMFIYLTLLFCERHPADAVMFVFILGVSFAMWLKVSTDIFLVYALFFFATSKEPDEEGDVEDIDEGRFLDYEDSV